MANATLNNVRVERIFGQDDQGAAVTEEIEITSGKRKGETFKRRWTLWSKGREPFEFDEGDILLTVTGELGTKISEWEDKKDGETRRTVDHTINDAVVTGASVTGGDEDEEYFS